VPRSKTARSGRSHPISRLGLIPALSALLLGAAVAPALADDSTPAPAPAPVAAPAPPAMTATSAEQSARLQAVSTGQPVTVDSLTTPTHMVVAQPDGSLTSTDTPLPVRVLKGGSWTALDATLTTNPDGTLSPEASANPISLSSGGDGPLATLTAPSGHTMSLTMPFTLPTPTVQGDTALYPSVLPGVDLSVTVTDQGGFDDVLIVHNATAAANPLLRKLTMAASTDGLSLTPTASGGMDATESDGTLAYTSPTPLMWDSSSTAAPAPSGSGSPSATPTASPTASAGTEAPAARKAQAAGVRAAVATPTASASSTTGTAPADTDPTTSSAQAPGTGAQVDPIAMTTGSGSITLVPDTSLLTSTAAYPVYLDPFTNPVPSKSTGYDEVYSSSTCSGSPQFDKPQPNGEGVGYQGYGGACGNGVERSYYSVDTSGLDPSMVVSKSILTIEATYAASYNCSQNQPITLHTTGSIGSGTDWNNQPGNDDSSYGTVSTTVPSAVNPNSSCSDHYASFDVTNQVKKIAAAGINTWTVGLFGDESNSADYLRMSSSLSMSTNFDIAPTVTDPTMTPAPLATTHGTACGDAAGGWIGATSVVGSSSNVKINTTTASEVTGTNVSVQFHFWDNMLKDSSGDPATVKWDYSAAQAPGPVTEPIGFTLQDGHRYGFSVQGYDGTPLYGNQYTDCNFSVDATPPNTPTVAVNPSFPPVGTGTANPVVYANSKAALANTFSVTATDPVPANTCTLDACVSSGIDHFRWNLDSPPTSTTGHNVTPSSVTTDAAGDSTGVATLPVPVANWGVHTLYVQAVDKAGNASQVPTSYTFTAPWNPSTKVTPGDLDGDGVPDLLTTTSTGDLVMLPGNHDTSLPAGSPNGPVVLAVPANVPQGGTAGWNNYLVAHRGNLNGETADDLFALDTKSADKHLYIVKNDLDPGGTGHAGFTLNRFSSAIPRPSCAGFVPANRCSSAGYDSTDWDQVTQIAAPGSVYGDGVADLITVENGELWLFQGVSGGTLTNPVLLGDGDWSHMDLITPGTVSGAPTLWARDRTNGTIYTYSLAPDSTTLLPDLLHAPTAGAPLTSGLISTGTTHLCVDDSSSLTTPGNKVQVYGCNKSGAQNWVMGTDGTVRDFGMCLDAYHSGTANGTLVDLWPCNGSGAQQWIPGADGILTNPESGRCLADPAANTTPGTQLILWDCYTNIVGDGAQDWNDGATTALPAATQTPIGTASAATYPLVTSPGDINSPSGGPDGFPDLYATNTSGSLVEFPGGKAAPGSLGVQDPTTLPLHWWQLVDNTDSGYDGNLNSGTDELDTTLANDAAYSLDPTLATADTNLGVDNDLTVSNTGTDPSSSTFATTTGYEATSGPAVDTSQSYTVSAWVKLSSLDSADQWAVGQGTDNDQAFALGYQNSTGSWAFTTSTNDDSSIPAGTYVTAAGSTAAQLNTWTHLVGVYDSPTGAMTLYVNGAKAGTATNTTPVYSPSHPLTIGAVTSPVTNPDGSTGLVPSNGFNGSIGDVRTYDSAIGTNLAIGSPSTLGALASTATDSWALTDGTGTTAADTATTNPATLNGGATWTSDATRGPVLTLNGSTGYAATSGPAVDTSQSYSVSAWVKLNSLTSNSTFVSQSDSATAPVNNGLQLYYSSTAKAWAFDRSNSDASGSAFTAAYGSTATTGVWTHLVGVFDANANTLTLYVNGVLAGTTPYTGSDWNAAGPLQIGRRVYSGTYAEYANASISDVHVYNTALPPADAADNNDTLTINQLD